MRSLIDNAKKGDDDAICALVNKYEPLISKYSFIYQLKNYSYEDLLQEGKLAVINAIKKYDNTKEKNTFDSYSITSIKNCYYMLARKNIRYNNESSVDIECEDDLSIIDLLESGDNIEKSFMLNADHVALKKAINSLSLEEKKILQIIFINDRGSLRKYCLKYDITFYYGKQKLDKLLDKLRESLI